MEKPLAESVLELVRSRSDPSLPPEVRPSAYWEDFCGYFRYVFALPEEELRRIRLHTYHLTSDGYQRYYFAERGLRDLLVRGQRHFLDRIGPGFSLEEGENGIGVDGPDGRVSHDLLRYLGVLVDLVESKQLTRETTGTVLEIGGGYGGLARAVCAYAPRIAYVISDLEETLFFSATYLRNELGAQRVHLVDDELSTRELREGHVYLTAQSRLEGLRDLRFDLAINQQSMQEMTRSQVERYCAFLGGRAAALYSCNLPGHGELAREKQTVLDLDRLIESIFPRVSWRSTPPDKRERFGDNTLERAVHVCG
jgi:SAM-dependent methyltransferase